jgi:hypothetical protein
LKRKLLWGIVIFTDEAIWEKVLSDTFWSGFNSQLMWILGDSCHHLPLGSLENVKKVVKWPSDYTVLAASSPIEAISIFE